MADGDVETHDTHPLVDHAQRHIAPGHRLFIGAPGLGGGEIGLEGQAVLLLIHIEGIAVLVDLALVLVLGKLSRQLLQILRRRLGGLVPGCLDGPAEHLAETVELPRRLRLVVHLKGAVPVAPGGGTGHGEVPVTVLVSGIDRTEGDLEAEAGEELQLFPAGGYSVDLHGITILSICLLEKNLCPSICSLCFLLYQINPENTICWLHRVRQKF